jgi:hypothetical protein
MASSSSSTIFRYVEEASPGVNPGTAGQTYRVTGGTLSQTVEYTEDNELRADRSRGDSIMTSGSVNGSLSINLSHKTHDDFLEALLADEYVGPADGIKTVADAVFNGTAHTIASTSAALPLVEKGQWFSITGAGTAGNRGVFRANTSATHTTSLITVDTVIKDVVNETSVSVTISTARLKQGNDDLRSFTIERELSDVSKFFVWKGVYVTSLNLSYSIGQQVNGTFGFLGMTPETTAAVTEIVTPANATTTSNFNSVTGTHILVDGVSLGDSCMESFTLDVNANLRERRCIGAGLAASDIGADQFTVTGSGTMFFGSTAASNLYAKKLLDQVITFTVAVTDQDNNAFAITFPRAKITAADVDGGGLGSDVIMAVTFTASRDTTTGTLLIIDRIGSVA